MAQARFATRFDQIDDPDALDFESHAVDLSVDEIVVFRSKELHALLRVQEVEAGPERGSATSCLKIKWELRTRARPTTNAQTRAPPAANEEVRGSPVPGSSVIVDAAGQGRNGGDREGQRKGEVRIVSVHSEVQSHIRAERAAGLLVEEALHEQRAEHRRLRAELDALQAEIDG